MDLSIVDVTDLPEDAVRAGDRAEFFGSSVDLDDFASRSGTIGYQVLTSLGPRYRREYLRQRCAAKRLTMCGATPHNTYLSPESERQPHEQDRAPGSPNHRQTCRRC